MSYTLNAIAAFALTGVGLWLAYYSVLAVRSRFLAVVYAVSLWVLGFLRIEAIDLELPLSSTNWHPDGETLPIWATSLVLILFGAKWGAFYGVIKRPRSEPTRATPES